MASMRAPARPSWANSPSAAWRMALRLASGWRRVPRRVVDETSSGIVLINQLVRLTERLARFNFSINGSMESLRVYFWSISSRGLTNPGSPLASGAMRQRSMLEGYGYAIGARVPRFAISAPVTATFAATRASRDTKIASAAEVDDLSG